MKMVKVVTKDGSILKIKNVQSFYEAEDEIELDNDFIIGQYCFAIDSDGTVVTTTYTKSAEFIRRWLEIGNLFHMKKEAEEASKDIVLYLKLRRFAKKVNDGWIPHMDTPYPVFFCAYDRVSGSWLPMELPVGLFPFTVCFRTEELAQRAIEQVIIPHEKEKSNEE